MVGPQQWSPGQVTIGEIDHVFLTGASSFIPALRRVFAFGARRLAGGDNFQAVAFGLALICLEDDLSP